MDYESCIDRILVSEQEITEAVDRIAAEIENEFKGTDKKLLLIGVLKGSVVFMSDLLKRLNIPLETDYIKVSSYGSSTTNGALRLKAEPDRLDLSDYTVIVIEDILDTGNTLSWLLGHLKTDLKAADVRLCVLFNKPDRRKINIPVDYQGFVIPDEFIVGYGLDYDELYRNLPYVGILKPFVYEK